MIVFLMLFSCFDQSSLLMSKKDSTFRGIRKVEDNRTVQELQDSIIARKQVLKLTFATNSTLTDRDFFLSYDAFLALWEYVTELEKDKYKDLKALSFDELGKEVKELSNKTSLSTEEKGKLEYLDLKYNLSSAQPFELNSKADRPQLSFLSMLTTCFKKQGKDKEIAESAKANETGIFNSSKKLITKYYEYKGVKESVDVEVVKEGSEDKEIVKKERIRLVSKI